MTPTTDTPTATQPGHVTVAIYNEDTGEVTEITAGRGWTLAKVIEEFYAQAGESQSPDDRIAFGSTGDSVQGRLGDHLKDIAGSDGRVELTFAHGTGGA